MKLNLDCVRSILLCVEENTGLRKCCFFVDTVLGEQLKAVGMDMQEPFDYQVKLIDEYNNDEIMYHVRYCIDADLIVETEASNTHVRQIFDLTPAGHEFLSNIRNAQNWEKTKDVGKKIGAFGLNIASKIAEGVATAYLKQQLGLL